MNPQTQQIQIKVDDATLKGVYANMMGVAHTKEEFVLDFINIYPAQATGVATARVIVSPGHMKRILSAIKDNIEKYEKNFGTIKAADAPASGEVGFKG
ncbi:DUF3467 domain-containing protein [Candidatus Parcubacteria bacterium]|jgi:hypothetical protein|nr:MAG: DUF3467 domain-containing protein [Candidatus Parcubacteria bacterium]